MAPYGRCLRCDGCRRTSAVLEEIQERSWSSVVPAVVLLWLDILPCLAPGVYTMLLAWTAQVSWKHVGWGMVRAEVLVGMIGWLWAYSYFFYLSSEKIVQDAVFCFNHNRNGHVQAMKHNEKYDIHEIMLNFLQFYSVWAWYQVMPWLLPCAFVPRRPSGMARSRWSTSSAKRWLDVAIFGCQQLLWLCCQPIIEHQTLLDPVVRSYIHGFFPEFLVRKW